MRYLFDKLVLALVGCAKPYGGDCDDIDGIKVTDFDVVPNDYTGQAIICRDGKVGELANYKDGKLDGVERQWHENGQLKYEANYKDGDWDGVYRQWNDNGQLETERNYKDGKEYGVERWWHENGQLEMERNYKDGKLDGVSRRWWSNGQLYFETNWKDGKKDGVSRRWYDNGQLWFECNNKDDEQDGVERWWYYNGQLANETNYKDGMLDGIRRGWWINGQLGIETNYKDGKIIDDKVVYYDEDGTICRNEYYENGIWVRGEGECNDSFGRFYSGINCEDVQGIDLEEDVVPDDYTGVTFWCFYGNVGFLSNYKDGKLDGVKRHWYENGRLYLEVNYKEGKIIDDKVVYYKEDGTIKKTDFYENGNFIRCTGDCD